MQGSLDPNLRGSDTRGGGRYPSPFFDISQQYVPPTVKELFKWVYFYATNNSFIGPALRKMARYPVTDLLLQDVNHDLTTRWSMLMNNTLQIKTFNMEVNHDLLTYGNAFVSIHYPFSRFLECPSCKERHPWKAVEKKIDNLTIKIRCKKCGSDVKANIVDVPFRSIENVRLVRINCEFIDIKYNDSTGRHTYLYSIPDKLKRQIMSGDVDIMEDTPKIYIDAIKQKKKIKLSNQNLYHLKLPTLAGKDMGWGLPPMANALKDLFYFYTLRRGQEAIMVEHITPFDIIFPQANGKFDPYVHSDLSNWKREMEKQLANKRRDPNYKAVVPFPIGTERLGGDGKNMLLTPEMDFLAKTIIGTMGIPQEFVYGGSMQWSGSSISLRTLENDFLHHRSQLLQMNIWLMERIRLYLNIACPRSIKFSDFKMADDVQKMQMMIGLASNEKLDWEDILKELGKDPTVVYERIAQEKLRASRMAEADAMIQAEAQAKAQAIQTRVMNADAQAAQLDQIDPAKQQTAEAIAKKLQNQDPNEQEATINRFKLMDPEFALAVEKALQGGQESGLQAPNAKPPQAAPQAAPQQQPPAPAPKSAAGKKQIPGMKQPKINMAPLPTQRPPRRQGGI